ncbi:MAG TPA: thioredoxin domain-containing protein [Clostridia bacterium]|nr:thioredoxin domain-containing protein [Clostridia bacterium]
MNTNKRANHLITEKSPYLLQHVYNPVNWRPWGREAFEQARREDKPVFLSIGYSTCHWCHVMERESFEQEDVAKLLNNDYISIKVDREERPDIDAVYMSVCQSMTGSGGWPLTIIMTPEQKPFYAATYIPKTSRYGNLGMLELIPEIARRWKTDKQTLITAGEEITAFISKSRTQPTSVEPSKDLLASAIKMYRQSFDKKYGGFGNAPKFPATHNLLFLMRYSQLENDKNALEMAEKTLVQMYKGGIFDHIGGGFSRYSTDEYWLVPHFEKMLYDNALLLLSYLKAYRITKLPIYRTVAEKILFYVFNELVTKQKVFCCGQDADSEGIEGKYYTFTPDEIKKVVGDLDGEAFCRHFDITKSGNFEGKGIPNLLNNPNFENSDNNLNKMIKKLYNYRLNRTKILLDDKILTSWNSLMIVALTKATTVLNDERYLKAAVNAEKFINENLTDKNGDLLVRWRENEAVHSGNLDDYAFYCLALIELYRTTFNVDYLEKALNYCKRLIEKFEDKNDGGFYLNAVDSEMLITRPKEVYDGAMPSGNSAAAMTLAEIAGMTGELEWRSLADKQFAFLAPHIYGYPTGYSYSLLAMTKVLYPSTELVCVSSKNNVPDELKLLFEEHDFDNIYVLFKTRKNAEKLSRIAPFCKDYPIPEHGTMYYLCRNGACEKPTNDIQDLKTMIIRQIELNQG